MKIRFILLIIVVFGCFNGFSQSYKFSFKVKGAEDTVIYLANYFGKQLYYKDTAYSDHDGRFTFEGKKKLLGGMYAVITPGPKYFELVINNEKISMETDTSNFIEHMQVKTSKENQLFYDYIKFIGGERIKSIPLKEQYQSCAEDSTADCTIYKEKIAAIDSEVKKYQEDLVANNPQTLLAKIISIQIDPKVPQELVGQDSLRYLWGLSHYFDNIDIKDDRVMQSPIFANKLDYYMNKMLIKNPDTICNAAFRLINQVDEKSEMFRYLVNTFTNNFNSSKIMGMDKVFYCMASKYYCEGKTWWMSADKLTEICDRVNELRPTLIGTKANNIILLDTGNTHYESLYNINSKFTMVLIWDPNCGHCKKEVPKLIDIYHKWKDKGLAVYAINNGIAEEKDWKKFIIDNNLDWINVHDIQDMRDNPGKYIQYTTIESINFRKYYDVFSTPKVYLLDKDKNIIAKQFSAEGLEEILNRSEENK